MKIKNAILFLSIFLFSFVLRLYHVGQIPSILNRDEAALAYNAKLLAETGQDEWQKKWPLALRSFGDYKLPGYVYTLSFLFRFLPQSDLVVRLPSIVAGALLPLLAFWFSKTFKFKNKWRWLFTFMIATTPVFFFYSRIAFEANLALALFVTSLTLLLREKTKTEKQQLFLKSDWLAILLMLGATFTYNSPLLLSPFIILLVIFHKGIHNFRQWWPVVMGLVLVLLLAGSQLLSLSSQKSGITIFQDETTWDSQVKYHQQFSGIAQTLLGNKYLFYVQIIFRNYLDSFSPNFLVKTVGGHPWHSLANHGHVLAVVYGLGILGIISTLFHFLFALKNKIWSYQIKSKLTLFYLLLVSLLPAVVTVDAPHATRSLFFFFIFTLFAMLGAKSLFQFLQKKFLPVFYLFQLALIFLIFISFSNYVASYFANFSHQEGSLKPGFAEVIQKVNQKYPTRQIAVIDEEGYQYILLAWYLKIDPEIFFQTTVKQLPDKIGFNYGERVTHYHFIAHQADRNLRSEKIVVAWDDNQQQWKIKKY